MPPSPAAVEIIPLRTGAPPTVIAGVGPEVEFPAPSGLAAGTTFVRNISQPTLHVYAPSAPGNGRAVIVVPGGGWTINAWDHEGIDVATRLAEVGYHAFVLRYRVQASPADQRVFEERMAAGEAALASPPPVAQRPHAIGDLITNSGYLPARAAAADDGRRAVELVRAEAGRFGVRPESVGMLGFSAGAFLAIDVALDPRAAPMAFAGAIYGGETRGAAVPHDAPPLFAAVARDDLLSVIAEGLHHDWSAAERPAELHVFARGGHGFGMIAQQAPSDHWFDLFLRWLADLG